MFTISEGMGTLLHHCWLFLVSTPPLSTSTVSTLTYPVRTKYVAVKLASERSYSLFQQACEACECYTKVNRAADSLIRRHQHLKLGTDRRVLYRPGSTVFVRAGECGVSGRAQYEWAGGVWVDTRRPAAQLSLDIQPLAPCTTYVEAGIYLHVNHFLEAATPETCVPATVARSRVTGANYLLVSASHRQQPRVRAPPLTGAGTGTAQQEFLCQYQAVGTGDYIDLRVR